MATLRPLRYFDVSTSFRDAWTLPYNSRVSYFTVTVNVSVSPANFKSFGTRHEYPQVPSQPKGIGPSETFLPDESVIVTEGSRDLCQQRSFVSCRYPDCIPSCLFAEYH